MKTQTLPFYTSLALGAALTLFVAGCNRTETTPAPAATPVERTVGMEIDDTVVTTRVKAALLEDKDVKGLDIKVETRKGVVQLSGFVDSRVQADRALAIARAAEGSKGAEDAMTLKEGVVSVGNQVDDGVVTTKVKSALLSDPSIKSFDIGVVTRKGEVQLSGFVASQAQIDHALTVARSVEGVRAVINQLAIKN